MMKIARARKTGLSRLSRAESPGVSRTESSLTLLPGLRFHRGFVECQ